MRLLYAALDSTASLRLHEHRTVVQSWRETEVCGCVTAGCCQSTTCRSDVTGLVGILLELRALDGLSSAAADTVDK
jgi:hypothetical protein